MNTGHTPITDEMLLSYLLGELAVYERIRVEEWLAMSPENRARMQKVEELWQKAFIPAEPPSEWDTGKAWDKVSVRIDRYEALRHRRHILVRNLVAITAAAAVIAAFVFIVKPLLLTSPQQVLITGVDPCRTDTLPDGSRVVLAKGATLSFEGELSDRVRAVKLNGDAWFEVTHDSLHPFRVEAKLGTVTVLGTTFLVKARGDSALYVGVNTGVVALSLPGSPDAGMKVVAGKAGVILNGHQQPDPAPVPALQDVYRYTGTLAFNDEPLRHVAEILALTHGIELRFGTPDVGELRLTATFSHETATDIVKVIAATLSLDVEAGNGGKQFILTADGSK